MFRLSPTIVMHCRKVEQAMNRKEQRGTDPAMLRDHEKHRKECKRIDLALQREEQNRPRFAESRTEEIARRINLAMISTLEKHHKEKNRPCIAN